MQNTEHKAQVVTNFWPDHSVDIWLHDIHGNVISNTLYTPHDVGREVMLKVAEQRIKHLALGTM